MPVWAAERVVFLNDVYFCARDVVRLLSHEADIACGLDFDRLALHAAPLPVRRLQQPTLLPRLRASAWCCLAHGRPADAAALQHRLPTARRGRQEQRKLFGRHLWRKYWLPPVVGWGLGMVEPFMWRWRKESGPANEEFQVPYTAVLRAARLRNCSPSSCSPTPNAPCCSLCASL